MIFFFRLYYSIMHDLFWLGLSSKLCSSQYDKVPVRSTKRPLFFIVATKAARLLPNGMSFRGTAEVILVLSMRS